MNSSSIPFPDWKNNNLTNFLHDFTEIFSRFELPRVEGDRFVHPTIPLRTTCSVSSGLICTHMFAWTRATGKNISRCRMSTKNSIGTGLQRPVEISFSLMTMSNSVVSPTLNVSSDMLPAHRPPPFFRSLAADRFFINIDSSVIPLFLLIFISYAKFSSFILITTFLLLTSSFQDSCICQKKEKKKGKEKGAEGKRIIVSKRCKKRRSLLVKRPSLSQRRPLSAPTEAGSGGLRLASRFLISASKQGASDFPSIERGCLWDGLTTSRHCISRTVRGRLDEFGRTAVQSA